MKHPTIRNLLISIVLFLLSGGAFFYLYAQIGQNEVKLIEQMAMIKTESDREQTSMRLQKIAETSKPDREKLASYFLPQAGESISFLAQVESLAPQNGIQLKTDALEEGSDKKTKDKWIEASFTFSGSRNNVEHFITILENLPYHTQIQSVQLAAKTGSEWEAKVTMRVAVMNYEK